MLPLCPPSPFIPSDPFALPPPLPSLLALFAVRQAYSLLPNKVVAKVDFSRQPQPLTDVAMGTGRTRALNSSTSASSKREAVAVATVGDLGTQAGEPNTQLLFDSPECRRFRDATGLEAFYR